MKHLRETFTDQEFEQLQRVKAKTNLNWHLFILTAAEVWERIIDKVDDEVKTK